MPFGICRFLGPVVSIAILMPLVPVSAQAATAPRPTGSQTIAEVGDNFIIRAAIAMPAEERPTPLRVGRSIKLDRALLEQTQNFRSQANEGGIHETR